MLRWRINTVRRKSLRAGRVTVSVPLNKTGRALLGRRRSLALTVAVVVRAPGARTLTTSAKTTVKLVRR